MENTKKEEIQVLLLIYVEFCLNLFRAMFGSFFRILVTIVQSEL